MKKMLSILVICTICGCTVNRSNLLYKRTRAKQQLAPPRVFADGQATPKSVVITSTDTTQSPKHRKPKKVRTHEKN